MLLGIDAFVSLILVVILVAFVPRSFPLVVARDFYALGASVLSIVFSVFTASLAIIISSPDDKFVQFLEAEDLYADILFGFKFTLLALFVALVYCIAAFGWTSYQNAQDITVQHSAGFITGSALICYALAATLTSSIAAIRHARARADYLRSAV